MERCFRCQRAIFDFFEIVDRTRHRAIHTPPFYRKSDPLSSRGELPEASARIPVQNRCANRRRCLEECRSANGQRHDPGNGDKPSPFQEPARRNLKVLAPPPPDRRLSASPEGPVSRSSALDESAEHLTAPARGHKWVPSGLVQDHSIENFAEACFCSSASHAPTMGLWRWGGGEAAHNRSFAAIPAHQQDRG
jgi:hypothetical protein